MFEKDLSDKLQRIFDLKKVTYSVHSESEEQECLFINVQSSKNVVGDGKFKGRVTGQIIVYGSLDKLPYGYFSKKIAEAKVEDVQNLFFFDFEDNVGTIENICQRTMSFVYLFDMQYNPNMGEITSLADSITTG